LLLRDECKRVHKRNLRLDFSITENNDTISTWEKLPSCLRPAVSPEK